MRRKGLIGYFGAAPRVRYEVDFTAPLWFGQEVTAILVLERIGGSSMTFRFEVWGEAYEGRGRELAASGRYVTVYVPRAAPGGTRQCSVAGGVGKGLAEQWGRRRGRGRRRNMNRRCAVGIRYEPTFHPTHAA